MTARTEMDEQASNPEGDRLVAIFDAAEEYAPFVDQLVERHKGQALPILLMLAANMCMLIEMQAQEQGKDMPVLSDEKRIKLDEIISSLVAHGPAYTGKLIISLVRWTSKDIRDAADIQQAERIMNEEG